MGSALAFAMQLLESLPGLIQAGADVAELISNGSAKLKEFEQENRDPTDEEWEELNASIDAKRDELHSGD